MGCVWNWLRFGVATLSANRRVFGEAVPRIEKEGVLADVDPGAPAAAGVQGPERGGIDGDEALYQTDNRFSKKIQNHAAMVAIHAVYYNFAKIHKTLRIIPSMAAGLGDHVRSLEEIVQMADNYFPKPAKRGPSRK